MARVPVSAKRTIFFPVESLDFIILLRRGYDSATSLGGDFAASYYVAENKAFSSVIVGSFSCATLSILGAISYVLDGNFLWNRDPSILLITWSKTKRSQKCGIKQVLTGAGRGRRLFFTLEIR